MSETLTRWPDWRGQACAIVASGPSAKAAGVEKLKGRTRVLAIKRSWELAPFADAIYGCDGAWWRSVNGLPEFDGFKAAFEPRACDEYHLAHVQIPEIRSDGLAFGDTGKVGAGGNSGFQALNLVAQWGASKVLLVGFDCDDRGGVHWYGRNYAPGMANPDESNFKRWRGALDGAGPVLAARGIEVLNASPKSTLKAFRKASIDEALEAWGLA